MRCLQSWQVFDELTMYIHCGFQLHIRCPLMETTRPGKLSSQGDCEEDFKAGSFCPGGFFHLDPSIL